MKQEEKMFIQRTDVVYGEVADFFKVLSDETRIKILCAISDKELCVKEITEILKVSSSLVSHQMRSLKAYKLVKQRMKEYLLFFG